MAAMNSLWGVLRLVWSCAGVGIWLWTCSPTEAAMRRPVWGPEHGDLELTLGGAGVSDRSFDSGSFAVNASIGYFLSPDFEVVLRQEFGFTESGDSSWFGRTRMALDYHLDVGRLRPFVGISGGGIYGDTLTDSFAAGFEAGLKYFLQRKAFVFVLADYHWLFNDADTSSSGPEEGVVSYTLGIGLNF